MTLTLEIPEQIERAAAQSQTELSSFILAAAAKEAANTYQVQTASRRAAVEAAFGCARGDNWIAADFNADKAADIEAENVRDLI